MRLLRTYLLRFVALAPLALAASALAEPPPAAAPAHAAAKGYPGFHVEPVAILSTEQRAALHVEGDHGSVVALVMPGGPADRAGLRVGDLVVRLGGVDAPDVTKPDRYDPEHRAWRAALRAWNEGLEAGRPVEVVVRRGAQTLRFEVTPATEQEIHRAMGGDDRPLPAPDTAGAPAPWKETFEAVAPPATLPAGWRPYEGRWQTVAEPGADPKNAVLRQDLPVLPWPVLLVTGPGRSLRDGRVKVRFRPVSGVVDASGGIVFRARDAKNYYVVRANALEDNWNLYVVKDGVRTTLKEKRVTPPSFGSWHTMEVRFVGDVFRATLDGEDVVEGRDATWAEGWVGLWTKADSVTLFDDLEVEPVGP